MKVIWVLENINKRLDFYSKFNTLLLLASIRLWKRNHPNDVCFFYCDELTYDFFKKLEVLHFWDEVIIFKPTNQIDKKVFWAASKLEILSKQDEPVLILDNDTLVYKPIKKFLDLNKVWVFNLEDGTGYYPTFYDQNVRNLSVKKRWKPNAVNVSFLFLPNPTFTQEYANLSLKFMTEFTNMGVDSSQYLVFSEQLLLRQMLDDNRIDYGSIVSNYEISAERKWGKTHSLGIWDENQYMEYIRHYGPYKNHLKEKKLEKEYFFELKSLFFSINFRNFHLTQFLNSNEYSK